MQNIDPLYELHKGKKLVNTGWKIQDNGDYLVMENNTLKFYQSSISEFIEPIGLFETEGIWELFEE